MDVNNYSIQYFADKPNEKVKAVAYELKDGWFVFYGEGTPAEQKLRVRATEVVKIVLSTE